MDNYVQRHFDYVLGPRQDDRLASVAAGAVITGLRLPLNSDAPFILRSRALRLKADASGADQTGLNHVLARWYGPDRNYTSQNYVRQSLLGPYFGQIGNPIPVHPEKFYPPAGEIRVDIQNDGSSTLTNLTFYFRGVKLYRPGAVKAYTYPPRCSVFPFTYPRVVDDLAVTTSTAGVRQIFTCRTDADFVLQGLQSGFPLSATTVREVFVQLKDEDEKPYSNDLVHVDILCGNSGMDAIYPAGTSARIAPVAGGPNSIGLVFPEIYIPRNHLLYYDVSRDDSAYAGAAVVDFPLQFVGQKVFEK